MESNSGGGQEGAHFPTLEQVYAAIMSQKTAQERLPAPAVQHEPVVRKPSGLRGSLRNNTLEQLLLQGLGAAADEGQHGPSLSIMRSNTIENILRGSMSTGKDLQDMILDWSHQPEEHRLIEGLASDMQAIDAAPPDVATLRRTFTLERILSGAEADLASALRHPHQTAPTQQPQPQAPQLHDQQQQQLQQLLQRQISNAATAAAAAGAGGDSAAAGEAGSPGRPSGRPVERLTCQESLHRLAASTGPGQPLPGRLSGPGAASSSGHPPAAARGGPPAAAAASGGTLLRSGHGSGRYGAAVSAALAADEEAQPSPKRHKPLHHIKIEGGGAGSSGSTRNGGPLLPERTWSASLLDLAKAAAALDGRDLDDEDDAAQPPPQPQQPPQQPQPPPQQGTEDVDGTRQREVDGKVMEGATAGQRGLGQQEGRRLEGAGAETRQDSGRRAGDDDGDPEARRWHSTGVAKPEGEPAADTDAAAAAALAGAVGIKSDPSHDWGQAGASGRLLERRNGGLAGSAIGPSGHIAFPNLNDERGGGVNGGSGSDGSGAAGPGGQEPAAGAMSAMQLLKTLSGMGAAGQRQENGGSWPGALAAPPQPSPAEVLLLKLRTEADRLTRDNVLLTGQLDAVLGAVDNLQTRNGRMKQMLLEACRSKGIQADLELLNMSLQHHRPPPMSDAAAASLAARVLRLNGGDVAATVQQLAGFALGRVAASAGGGLCS